MRFLSLLFVFSLLVAYAAGQCTLNGVDYSGLSALADGSFSTVQECGNSNANYAYSFALCRAVTTGPKCSADGAFMCQNPATNDNPVADMAYTSVSLAQGLSAKQAIVINGYNTQNKGDKWGQITVYCPSTPGAPQQLYNPAVTGTVAVGTAAGNPQDPSANCNYHPIAISLACICDASCGAGSASKSAGGLSGGWIFCIILFVVVPVYFAAGCGMNYHKGSRGCSELTPNYAFWAAIPGLFKDGCAFTYQKIRGLCGGKAAGTYETL